MIGDLSNDGCREGRAPWIKIVRRVGAGPRVEVVIVQVVQGHRVELSATNRMNKMHRT